MRSQYWSIVYIYILLECNDQVLAVSDEPDRHLCSLEMFVGLFSQQTLPANYIDNTEMCRYVVRREGFLRKVWSFVIIWGEGRRSPHINYFLEKLDSGRQNAAIYVSGSYIYNIYCFRRQ